MFLRRLVDFNISVVMSANLTLLLARLQRRITFDRRSSSMGMSSSDESSDVSYLGASVLCKKYLFSRAFYGGRRLP